MSDELEVVVVEEMLNILLISCEIIINTNYFIACL